MRNLERHPGISMHRIAVGGGVMGALFAVGTTLIFVIGVPFGGWFLLASIELGTGVAAVLYAWHKKHPVDMIDLHPPTSNGTQQVNNNCQNVAISLTTVNECKGRVGDSLVEI